MLDQIKDLAVTGIDPDEMEEWFDSLDDVLHRYGPKQLQELLVVLQERAYHRGVTTPFTANTPYINTIPLDKQPRYPGDLEIERRIKSHDPLERDGDGAPGQQTFFGPGRAHLDVRVLGDALRSGLQSFLPGADERAHGRHGVFPRPRRSGNVRPRVSRRPLAMKAISKNSAGRFREARGCRPIRIPG